MFDRTRVPKILYAVLTYRRILRKHSVSCFEHIRSSSIHFKTFLSGYRNINKNQISKIRFRSEQQRKRYFSNGNVLNNIL